MLPYVYKVSGVLLVVAGLYVAYYGWYELRVRTGETSGGGAAEVVFDWNASISNWVQQVGPVRLGILLAAAVGVVVALTWAPGAAPNPDPAGGGTVAGHVRRAARPPRGRGDHALRSPFGFMAFHGGSLEQMTDVIAAAAAERAGASLLRRRAAARGFRWHLPSTEIDPAYSAAARRLPRPRRRGRRRARLRPAGACSPPCCWAGSNRELAATSAPRCGAALARLRRRRRPRRASRVELRGLHPDNPVNRPRHGGVQLELPPRVRGLGPFWADFRAEHGDDAHPPHTEALIAALADAADAWSPALTSTRALSSRHAAATALDSGRSGGGSLLAMELRIFIEPQQGASYADCSPSPSGPRSWASTPSSVPTTSSRWAT